MLIGLQKTVENPQVAAQSTVGGVEGAGEAERFGCNSSGRSVGIALPVTWNQSPNH